MKGRALAVGGLVYSTEGGRMCPQCRQPLAQCACADAASMAAPAGKLRVALEKKGRGGKTVTVVRGLPLAPDALAVAAKQLRGVCGAGGTVKDGVVEIQGDHCARVTDWLRVQGHLR